MDRLFESYEYLHRHPELSGQEEHTAGYLMSSLSRMGYVPVRIGKCSVYADLLQDASAPWILLRSDMDALPVQEETDAPYASEHSGVMHACGHDAHMAMLLKAAEALREKNLPQNIRFLFQSAEESVTGAEEAINCGVMPENCVAVFGMHVWPGVPKGNVLAKEGPLMASATSIRIDCKGLSAHCGNRERGRDAMMTAAQILARSGEVEVLAEGDGSILFFGKLRAGTGHNIVAAEAVMEGTLRSFYPQTREKMLKKLEQIAAEEGKNYGTEVQVSYGAYAPSVINPEEITRKVQALFPDAVTQMEPTRIGEDFARYQQVCPGVLLWLGVGDTPSLHNSKFLVPVDVLPVGVETWVRLAQSQW